MKACRDFISLMTFLCRSASAMDQRCVERIGATPPRYTIGRPVRLSELRCAQRASANVRNEVCDFFYCATKTVRLGNGQESPSHHHARSRTCAQQCVEPARAPTTIRPAAAAAATPQTEPMPTKEANASNQTIASGSAKRTTSSLRSISPTRRPTCDSQRSTRSAQNGSLSWRSVRCTWWAAVVTRYWSTPATRSFKIDKSTKELASVRSRNRLSNLHP